MTIDATLWVLALVWGGILGLFYFGGLWLTLKAILGKRLSQQWLAVSWLVRMTVILAGFWGVVRTDPGAFFLTLGGFFLVRTVLTRKIGHAIGDRHHAAHP